MDLPILKDKVHKIFSDYLEQHQQRKTKERFAILDLIYSLNYHFDTDSLYRLLLENKIRVSRATVYNTLELLLECDLIIKHQFKNNMAQYEKSHQYKQHDHLICEDCGRVLEFCDPRIQQIQSMMGEILQFNVTHHRLNLYGKCIKLQSEGKCEYLNLVD